MFLGYAAGVGKTYAMLEAAHQRRDEDVDVVVGYAECHGRPETEALLADLEVIPPRQVEYRGATLTEMDTDAVLARRPQLALVDDLAHTNAFGSRHTKRFLDVEELLAAGIDPATITDVVVTHLHFDHAGGLTHLADGQVRPTFPHARVHVQRQELADARRNFGVMTATYREENFHPLDAADAWHLLDGETEIVPGVRPRLTPGHTRGHHSIVVTGRDRTLVYGGDLLPTRHHAGAAYNMSYDLYPLENRASKQKLLAWLAGCDGLLALDHEIDTPVVAVRPDGDWFRLEPAAATG